VCRGYAVDRSKCVQWKGLFFRCSKMHGFGANATGAAPEKNLKNKSIFRF
jgi:hypothetical protein